MDLERVVQFTPAKVSKEGCLSPVTPVQGSSKPQDAEQVPTRKRRCLSQAFQAKQLTAEEGTAEGGSVQAANEKLMEAVVLAPHPSFCTPSPRPPAKKRSRAQAEGPGSAASTHTGCGVTHNALTPPSFQRLQVSVPKPMKPTIPAGRNLLEQMEAAKSAAPPCEVDSLLCDETECEAQWQELLVSSKDLPASELEDIKGDAEEKEEEAAEDLKPLAPRKSVIERVPSLAQWMSRLTGAGSEDLADPKLVVPLKGVITLGELAALHEEMPKKTMLDRMIEQLEAEDDEDELSEEEADADNADAEDTTTDAKPRKTYMVEKLYALSRQLVAHPVPETQEPPKKSMADVLLEQIDSMIPSAFDGHTSNQGLLKSSSFSFC